MAVLSTREKLAILSDAAKYDASCASSGSKGRDSSKSKGIGSTEGMGICHSYAPDGRCISLLKILLTNFCIYDCAYCINRSSSNVQRARFSIDEVVRLTIEFYKRNYIEGLFLSSGVIRSPDETMAAMVEVARRLREEERYNGYIHLKTIPECAQELIEQAAGYADRLSINIELPTDDGVKRLAPEKKPETKKDEPDNTDPNAGSAAGQPGGKPGGQPGGTPGGVVGGIGKKPQKPYSGNLMLRVDPAVHSKAAMAAELAGKSLNQWGEDVLREAAAKAGA